MSTLLVDEEIDHYSRELDKILSVFRKEPKQVTDIEEWMTPEEIAEFISDRLIAIIKEQFDAAGKRFEEREK